MSMFIPYKSIAKMFKYQDMDIAVGYGSHHGVDFRVYPACSQDESCMFEKKT